MGVKIMCFSVVISAYNTHAMTAAHVRASVRCSSIPAEVIVVNDGGDPFLKEMLEQIPIPGGCTLIYARINQDIPWNYTGARNLGVALACNPHIILEDSDHIPAYDFYRLAVNLLQDYPDIVKVQCKTRHRILLEDLLTKPQEDWTPLRGNRGTHYDTGAFRRLDYLRIKGFDEEFAGRCGWANLNFNERLSKLGRIASIDSYSVVVDGIRDQNIRKPSGVNHSLLLQKRKRPELTHAKGILNFDYEVFILRGQGPLTHN